jgi:hypothetical protein
MIIVLRHDLVFLSQMTPECVFVVASDCDVENIGGVAAWVAQEERDIAWVWSLEGEGVWVFKARGEGSESGRLRVEIKRERFKWMLILNDLRKPGGLSWEVPIPQYDATQAPRGHLDYELPTLWDHLDD